MIVENVSWRTCLFLWKFLVCLLYLNSLIRNIGYLENFLKLRYHAIFNIMYMICFEVCGICKTFVSVSLWDENLGWRFGMIVCMCCIEFEMKFMSIRLLDKWSWKISLKLAILYMMDFCRMLTTTGITCLFGNIEYWRRKSKYHRSWF